MANLAQLVNVLQAPILTEGEKMVKTPTYYLLKMMKEHQDSDLLDVDVRGSEIEFEDIKIPKVSVSATLKDDKITVSMCNTDVSSDEEIEIEVRDADVKNVSAQILAASDMHDPNTVVAKDMTVTAQDNKLSVKVPAMSVVVLTIGK